MLYLRKEKLTFFLRFAVPHARAKRRPYYEKTYASGGTLVVHDALMQYMQSQRTVESQGRLTVMEVNMVALRQGLFTRRGTPSQRATANAFKVGERVYKKKGVSADLREAVRLYRESLKSE